LAFFGFNRETSIVQFETNAIYGFVPSSIYSRKKQMPVFKGQLFILLRKIPYAKFPAYLVPDVLFKDFYFCPVRIIRCYVHPSTNDHDVK
jgi:hypothetical protein